tara:strand:- start:2245 stop:4071 length:1827 start_codon:yes stop_codon:yes gene_type:complete
MCGIFGITSKKIVNLSELKKLASLAQQRGKDSSGLIVGKKSKFIPYKADNSIMNLIHKADLDDANLLLGHSRLITNGHADNQPVIRDKIMVLHNGIITNFEELWDEIPQKRKLNIDTEIIAGLAENYLIKNDLDGLSEHILSKCKGVVACAIVLLNLGKLIIFSNNGSLFYSEHNENFYFSSEEYPLKVLGLKSIHQLVNDSKIIDIEKSEIINDIIEFKNQRLNLVPELVLSSQNEKLLKYEDHDLKRCTKCILPETMPYISFDDKGVCNYCNNYQLRNVPKKKEILFDLVEKYRRSKGNDCIVPFSGGRDSCYSLHLIVKELKLKPIAYTYDWGMVTDLGRRNISRMCSKLGVENIIVADDITLKRKNIAMNIEAWLKSPNLGMVSIFTAGDKHFFRHVETVKKQTGISLNLWGVNPLEVTHFKAGFLGIPPDFEEKKVYSSNGMKQMRYQYLRLNAMLKSLGYFNSSLWDTLSGEYWRSYHKKIDYFHVFDYWRWEEDLIDDVLLGEYDWEKAPDTNTTWRIGDGTAAFYNYIYYCVAGFTEHDTFRSNQIREGDITRDKALDLIKDENRPRYPNLQWYLDSVGLDFEPVIKKINDIPTIKSKVN